MNNDLISREALIKWIDDSVSKYGHIYSTDTLDMWGLFKDYLINFAPTVEAFTEEQVKELIELNKELSEERPQGEWIPITEKLPNTLGVYNVTRKLKEGETIYFISDASYFDGQNTWYADTGINHGRPYLTDIIAWQPRPEPYKTDMRGKEE